MVSQLDYVRTIGRLPIVAARQRRRRKLETPRSEFAGRIVAAMDRAGLNQEETEKKAGLSKGYVSRLLNEERSKIKIETIEKLATALGVRAAWLAFGEGDMVERRGPAALEDAIHRLGAVDALAIDEQRSWAIQNPDEAARLTVYQFAVKLRDRHNELAAARVAALGRESEKALGS